jgi:preprotein translocase, SecE subunit, bacterial
MAEKESTAGQTNENKPSKPKKDKIPLGQRIKTFFKTYRSEMKKISWASLKSVQSNTLLVLVCIVILSAFIGLIDYAFSLGIVGLGRLI